MKETYHLINTRNSVRAEVARRVVDIEPVLEQLKQGRRHLNGDIETYTKYK